MPDEKKVMDFLSNSENKTKLNAIIQKHCANSLLWEWSGEVAVTFGKRIWARSDGLSY